MPDSLTPGDGQDLLARFKQARQKRDPDMMVDLFSPDAEYRSDPFDPPMIGANAIRAYWNTIATDQAHVDFDAERIWVVGHTVLSSWHASFTLRSSAARIRVRGFSTMEIDESGLIRRLREWPSVRDVGLDSRYKLDPVPEPEPVPEPPGGEPHG